MGNAPRVHNRAACGAALLCYTSWLLQLGDSNVHLIIEIQYIEQHISVFLFVMLYKVVPTF